MAIPGKNPLDGSTFYISATGTGTELDPYIIERRDETTHNKLDSLIAINSFSAIASDVSGKVVKNSNALLRSLYVINQSDVTLYLQFHNTAILPSNGSGVDLDKLFLVPQGIFAIGKDLLGEGRSFPAGLTYTLSIAKDVYTEPDSTQLANTTGWIAYL